MNSHVLDSALARRKMNSTMLKYVLYVAPLFHRLSSRIQQENILFTMTGILVQQVEDAMTIIFATTSHLHIMRGLLFLKGAM
jgi:hypothetical protein